MPSRAAQSCIVLLVTALLAYGGALTTLAQQADTPENEETDFYDNLDQTLDQIKHGLSDLLRHTVDRFKSSPSDAGAKIVGVPELIDADTLVINDQRIRLWGIDAPETDQTCRYEDGSSYPCGVLAARRLERRINRQTLHCEPLDTDAYGRTLCRCLTQSGDDLAAWLTTQGLAKAYTRYTHTYQSFETSARNARRGFWTAGPNGFDDPADWRRN